MGGVGGVGGVGGIVNYWLRKLINGWVGNKNFGVVSCRKRKWLGEWWGECEVEK